MASHWDPVVDELKEQGFVVERTEGNHWSVRSPNGGRPIHFSYSNEPRALKNTLADLKKYLGFVWPPSSREKKNGVGQSSKEEICCTLCHDAGGCKDGLCVCHEPEPVLVPKTSEELYKDYADSRISLQLAEEQLTACKVTLQEAQQAVDEALVQRTEAHRVFRASKKRFDDDMLAGIPADDPKEEPS